MRGSLYKRSETTQNWDGVSFLFDFLELGFFHSRWSINVWENLGCCNVCYYSTRSVFLGFARQWVGISFFILIYVSTSVLFVCEVGGQKKVDNTTLPCGFNLCNVYLLCEPYDAIAWKKMIHAVKNNHWCENHCNDVVCVIFQILWYLQEEYRAKKKRLW